VVAVTGRRCGGESYSTEAMGRMGSESGPGAFLAGLAVAAGRPSVEAVADLNLSFEE